MIKTLVLGFLVAAPLTIASAATRVDNYAASAIQSAQYQAAASTLESRVALVPTDESAIINLAHVYARTSRTNEAAALYRRVLVLNNVQLAATDGRPLWSHDIARAALARVVTLTSR